MQRFVLLCTRSRLLFFSRYFLLLFISLCLFSVDCFLSFKVIISLSFVTPRKTPAPCPFFVVHTLFWRRPSPNPSLGCCFISFLGLSLSNIPLYWKCQSAFGCSCKPHIHVVANVSELPARRTLTLDGCARCSREVTEIETSQSYGRYRKQVSLGSTLRQLRRCVDPPMPKPPELREPARVNKPPGNLFQNPLHIAFRRR